MHISRYSSAVYLTLGFSSCMAMPRPASFILPQCSCEPYPYNVTSQLQNQPGPAVVGDYTVQGGGSLTASSTFSVEVTWQVGINLNLDPAKVAGSGGIGASVATTHSSGKTQGATGSCPAGPWSCSLSISPQVVQVSGFATLPECCLVTSMSPYTVLLPQKSSDGLVHASIDICTCQNFPGWAEPGHPGLICPQDCVE